MHYTVFASKIANGDAVGEDACGMAAALAEWGGEVQLLSKQSDAAISSGRFVCKPTPEPIGSADALVFHHCFDCDGWRELLEDCVSSRVLRYHSITPPHFFRGVSHFHAQATAAGRRQTRQIVDLDCELYWPTSDFTRQELVALGAPPERCFVVPPFHRLERLLRLAPNQGVLNRYLDGRRNLLAVGVLAPHKNQLGLVRAFAALSTAMQKNVRLILVGNEDPRLAPWAARLQSLVAKLGLSESIVVTGKVSEAELATYYRAADLFVSASRHEGFGVPLIEAMAFGVPIVALAKAAVPETIGDAGLLVDGSEDKNLAGAILKALSDNELRANLISAGHRRYETEFSLPVLRQKLASAVEHLERISAARPPTARAGRLTDVTVVHRTNEYIDSIEPYPETFHSRGIVICAGGVKYLTGAWVLINQLRSLGCRLPIQVWQRGPEERDRRWSQLVAPLDVECVDAWSVRDRGRHPRGGWELKRYAILHSPFEEVLLLDADNVPVADPTYLFDDPAYRQSGAIFWPDGMRTPPESPRWRIFNVPYRDELEQESGQILINKRQCWRALKLCNWYNEHSDYFYRVIYGDKDTFRFAWHRLEKPFAMPRRLIKALPATLCQHDLQGRRIFQHRVHDKWSVGGNRRIPGFLYEAECLAFVEDLRRQWDVVSKLAGRLTPRDRSRMRDFAARPFEFFRLGFSHWPIRFDPLGYVQVGRTQQELFWWCAGDTLVLAGSDGAPSCDLRQRADGVWEGRSFRNPRLQCELRPTHEVGAEQYGSFACR